MCLHTISLHDALPICGDSTGGAPAGATPENLRVAFFGDHGLGSESVATLELVISEDADFLVILGDFDYGDDPEARSEERRVGKYRISPMSYKAVKDET